jgi:DNA-binding response OmpR family regulator
MESESKHVKKVLTIEDERDLREAIVTSLTYEGYRAIAATDGEEGLKCALREKPDLILLDIIMPKMSGIELLKRLREDTWGKDARVVILTALDDMDKVAEAIELGGLEYLVKSNITLADITSKVKQHIGSAV